MSDIWYCDKGRIASLVIASCYLIFILFFGKAYDWLRILIFLIFPLACIWFGDELGNYEGPSYFRGSGGWISKTPGCFVKLGGWVLLLLPGILLLILIFYK